MSRLRAALALTVLTLTGCATLSTRGNRDRARRADDRPARTGVEHMSISHAVLQQVPVRIATGSERAALRARPYKTAAKGVRARAIVSLSVSLGEGRRLGEIRTGILLEARRRQSTSGRDTCPAPEHATARLPGYAEIELKILTLCGRNVDSPTNRPGVSAIFPHLIVFPADDGCVRAATWALPVRETTDHT